MAIKDKKLILVSLLLLVFMLYIAVDKDMNSYQIYVGKYICVSEGMADSWVQVDYNSDVKYFRGTKLSNIPFDPYGDNQVKGNKFILHTVDGDVIFKIRRGYSLELIEDPLFQDYEGKIYIFHNRK